MTSSFEKYLSNIYYCRDASDNVWMSQGWQSANWRHEPGSGPELELTNQQQQFNSTWAEL